MNRSLRSLCLILAMSCLACGRGLAQFTAIPKRPGQILGPSRMPPKPKPPPRYERLLIKYLQNIDEMAREREQAARGSSDFQFPDHVARDAELARNESEVLERLRTESERRSGKKLDFDGEVSEYSAFSPYWPASARIFAVLSKEKKVDAGALLPLLLGSPAGSLCQEWIAYVSDVAKQSKPGTRQLRQAIMILYKAGVSRDQYLPVLQRMATKDHSVTALELLFYDVDPETGQRRKVVNMENLSLMRKRAAKGNPPEIRIACAEFAAELRDSDLAQAVCEDLLFQRYKGFDRGVRKSTDEDSALFRARQTAMLVLFYRVRNERAFKVIFDRSIIVETQMREHERDNATPGRRKNWLLFNIHPHAKMEVDFAQSMIRGVADFGRK